MTCSVEDVQNEVTEEKLIMQRFRILLQVADTSFNKAGTTIDGQYYTPFHNFFVVKFILMSLQKYPGFLAGMDLKG